MLKHGRGVFKGLGSMICASAGRGFLWLPVAANKAPLGGEHLSRGAAYCASSACLLGTRVAASDINTSS